ncbi:MAG: hypothetical protein GY723_15455 [bacterium]|nr:hypothetical protein [bacterium]MCP5065940.1 hypothetical protein [bacterium]
MSEKTHDRIEGFADGMVDVAAAWFQVGVMVSETAISAAADGLRATAEAISVLSDQAEGDSDRSS